jgi:tetratricopeptide (TPR) repeat protein
MRRIWLLMLTLLLLTAAPVLAQGGGGSLPETARLDGFRHEYQGWNNCGPATLTMGLTYFGWEDDQFTAAAWLKPDSEDKNVSAWQMAEFVNQFTEFNALVRYGGDLDRLKALIANGFPVIIAAGYQPEGYDWMGHYLLVAGYDDSDATMLTQDSFLGPDTVYAQTEIDFFWRHFNRVYLVLYAPEQESDLLALLGDDADEQVNAANALTVAREEAVADSADPFAWFNMGTSYTLLEQYEEAAVAFDQARNVGDGLPWRMAWYQFGTFEAYYQTGRYEDVIALAQYNLSTTPDGEHPIEETYYYAGLARDALGDVDRAILNLQQAALINPNFAPAVEALAAIAGTDGG